jgi:glycerate dehydrogenase
VDPTVCPEFALSHLFRFAEPLLIVSLHRGTISAGTYLRSPGFPNEWVQHDRKAAHEVVARITDADIVIVNKVKLVDDALASAPRLKLIAVAATGTDNVDLSACHEHGIVVCNARN